MARVDWILTGKRLFTQSPVLGATGCRRATMMLLAAGLLFAGQANARADQAFDQKIAAREAKLTPKDAVERVNIATLLYNHHQYKRAMALVNQALAINPQLQDAHLLKRLINRKMGARPATGTQAGPAAATSQPVHKLLTMKQIYMIRLWELSRRETAPLQGLILDRTKTLNKFWHQDILLNQRYQNPPPTRMDYEAFISPTNLKRQIQLMRRFGNPAILKKIEIQSDPDALRTYRTYIQPFVLQSCSTVGCHRGQDFSGFKLFGAAGVPNVRQTYTNFYILTHYRYKGQALVNQDSPNMSLILQYVANPDVAAYRHPGKKNGPVRRRVNTKRIVAWIESLRYPHHSYGFTYTMPKPVHQP